YAELDVQMSVEDAELTAFPVAFYPTEFQEFSGVVGAFRDANPNPDLDSFTAVIDWGDGTSADEEGFVAINNHGDLEVSGSHTYYNRGVAPVAVTLIDADGSDATLNTAALVSNIPWNVTPLGLSVKPGKTFKGTVATFVTSPSDLNPDDYGAVIDWGDGTIE